MHAKISLLKVIFEIIGRKRVIFGENIGNHHIQKDLIRFYKSVLMTTSTIIRLSILSSVFGSNILSPLVLLSSISSQPLKLFGPIIGMYFCP